MSQGHAAQAEMPGIVKHDFKVSKCGGKLTVYLSDDGMPCEIEVKIHGHHSAVMGGVMNAVTESVTMGLQHGIPLDEFCERFIGMKFVPYGLTTNPDIPFAESVIDYIFTWLAIEFLSPDDEEIPDPDDADAPEPDGADVIDLQERAGALNEPGDPLDGDGYTEPGAPRVGPLLSRRRGPPVDRRQTSFVLDWSGR